MNREVDVLAMAPQPSGPTSASLERDYRERNGIRDGSDYSERLDRRDQLSSANKGPILSAGGKPLRPFTLLNSRQTLKDGVFRPGHNLPTMTIDEYLEEERARGGIIEGGGEASGISPEPDEDNIEKADEEVMKAREWDEFVEANPKYVSLFPKFSPFANINQGFWKYTKQRMNEACPNSNMNRSVIPHSRLSMSSHPTPRLPVQLTVRPLMSTAKNQLKA
jgi:hypothetical protein